MRSVVMDESRPNFGENAPVLEPLAQPRPKHAFHHGLGSALARQQIHRAVERELACKLVSEIEAQTRAGSLPNPTVLYCWSALSGTWDYSGMTIASRNRARTTSRRSCRSRSR